jgi:hypothetical protein
MGSSTWRSGRRNTTPRRRCSTRPSWLIGDRRPFAQTLAFAAAAILILAGVALWAQGGWWRPTAVVGLAASTALLLLYFNPWYLFILAVNTALIVGIAGMDWPARSTVGA